MTRLFAISIPMFWLRRWRLVAGSSPALAALTSAQAAPAADPKIDESYLALLAHPDLSSPRATLMSLQESVQQAYRCPDQAPTTSIATVQGSRHQRRGEAAGGDRATASPPRNRHA